MGASLAGLALAIHPEGEARNGVAVWVVCKALEYAFNLAEGRQIWGERPWVCTFPLNDPVFVVKNKIANKRRYLMDIVAWKLASFPIVSGADLPCIDF